MAVRPPRQRSQATVEAVGLVPAVVLVGLACLQLLGVGYAKVLAGSAAEAGALALAAGADPRAGFTRRSPVGPCASADRRCPGNGRGAAAPPSALDALADRLAVESRSDGGPMSGLTSWLLEPAAPDAPSPVGILAQRPVIAVFGLSRGCGATVVARALAAELAARDSAGAAAVSCEARGSAVSLATPAATRLARSLADVPGAATRAVGRLPRRRGRRAGAGGLRPALRAAGARRGLGALGGRPAALADRCCSWLRRRRSRRSPPSRRRVCARVGPEPFVVVNGGGGHGAWRERAVVTLPRSRMGAQLALGGREPRGELGRAVERLADLVEGDASRAGPSHGHGLRGVQGPSAYCGGVGERCSVASRHIRLVCCKSSRGGGRVIRV